MLSCKLPSDDDSWKLMGMQNIADWLVIFNAFYLTHSEDNCHKSSLPFPQNLILFARLVTLPC